MILDKLKKIFITLVLLILLCSSITYARNALTAPGFDRYMAEHNLIAFLNGDNVFTGDNIFWNVTYLNQTVINYNSTGNINLSGIIYASNFCYLNGSCINTSYPVYNDVWINNTFYSKTVVNALILGNKTDAGNSSWNESYADTLYAPISIIGDNTSWNKTYADTLYAAIGSGGNTSFNQTLTDSLYAFKGTGGNTSWNQTLADTLYAPLGSNVTADSMWSNTVNFAYIKNTKPQAINVTKTCLSPDCSNYQLIEKNITSTVITWY
jgi:hypothetical protein